ncbi:MarR family winged helix-turn-helix transcriptional regulator [Diaphorobacter caeni]|uniref:MarR family winged helix-turn-helix transcriptional regulator n=1 Tax=Diaphorobacter caeni TaxID=2784387 RepID=UPI00188F45B9|nr:MarR family winged helix-turn-helix transcriptional regulator [Diaphorobacter caeni]MBF5006105.1 winged helix-turn-helix transcriptional regulator [Diaphorobacter caeni]
MPRPPRFIHLLNSAQRRLQLRVAAEQASAAADASTAPSPAQAGVLFSLAKHDGATMGNLSQALDLVPSAVSGLVQRMEALGWVQRRSCGLDARTQRVWLLPAGGEQLPALHSALKRINADLSRGFSSAELEIVGRWLAHVQGLPLPSSTPTRKI